MTPPLGKPLPVTLDMRPGEDIAAFLARLAEANHLSVVALTGHPRRARLWERPPQQVLRHLAALTGLSEARLRPGVITTAYQHAHLHNPRTGRRWAGQPATCPNCAMVPVAARLNLVAACPMCHSLLVDRLDPEPPPAPQGLLDTQSKVLATLTGDNAPGQMQITLLPELIPPLEPAIRDSWPPLLEGETVEWRSRTVRFLDWALRSDRPVARPPSVLGTLIAMAWPHTVNGFTARDFRDECAVMVDPWRPGPHEAPRWSTVVSAKSGIHELLLDLDLRPEHIPNIIRRVDEPLVLPRYLRPARVADALTLTILASHAHGLEMTLKQARKHHCAGRTDLVGRLVTKGLADESAHHRLAVHARYVHCQGVQDLERARAEFRRRKTVPPNVLRLAGPDLDPSDGELAAAWVWLDATKGSPTGGPHPILPIACLIDFDTRLNPETKLHLRAWWQNQLTIVDDMIDGETAPALPATNDHQHAN